MDASALLRPGETCWRTGRADRMALLVDAQAYFAAAEEAMANARSSITLIGWHFDSRTRLKPFTPDPHPMGRYLIRLARQRPELQVRVLIWNMSLVVSAGFDFYPGRARAQFLGTPVKFRLDRTAPFGSSHHQKLLVIDDKVAFCGGADFSVDRWDTARHLDDDPRRLDPDGDLHPPRHEVMSIVDGEAASMIAELARERWRRGTGETLRPAAASPDHDPWPQSVPAALKEVHTALARTDSEGGRGPGLQESQALHLAAIASARSVIYLENQYVTSRVIAEALAARLEEEDGPEVVIVSTRHSPSWFDRATMDAPRVGLLERLRAADRHGRFSAWCPTTAGGDDIIVHSKVSVIDDRLFRVGSTNLNNRSLGFDTECDLALWADTQEARDGVRVLRDRLIGHFIGCTGASFSEMVSRCDGVGPAIKAFCETGAARLHALPMGAPDALGTLVSTWQLGDPISRHDSFRPWKRRKRVKEAAERARLTVKAGAEAEG